MKLQLNELNAGSDPFLTKRQAWDVLAVVSKHVSRLFSPLVMALGCSLGNGWPRDSTSMKLQLNELNAGSEHEAIHSRENSPKP
jgi:hypothetical protein